MKNLNGDKSFNDHTVIPASPTHSPRGRTRTTRTGWRDGNLILVVGTSGDAEAAGASTTAIQSILTNAIRNGPGDTTTTGSFGPIGQTEGCAWLTKEDLTPYVAAPRVPYVTSGHSALIDDCEWDTRPNDIHATEYEPHTVIYQVQYFSSLEDGQDHLRLTLRTGVRRNTVHSRCRRRVLRCHDDGTGEVTVSQVRFGHYISPRRNHRCPPRRRHRMQRPAAENQRTPEVAGAPLTLAFMQ